MKSKSKKEGIRKKHCIIKKSIKIEKIGDCDDNCPIPKKKKRIVVRKKRARLSCPPSKINVTTPAPVVNVSPASPDVHVTTPTPVVNVTTPAPVVNVETPQAKVVVKEADDKCVDELRDQLQRFIDEDISLIVSGGPGGGGSTPNRLGTLERVGRGTITIRPIFGNPGDEQVAIYSICEIIGFRPLVSVS